MTTECDAMITKSELVERLAHACAELEAAEDELTGIDAQFGDADHGLTMVKIAHAIQQAACTSQGGIRELFDDAAMAVMALNGGSAVPLWNTWLDGLQEGAPEGDWATADHIRAMFSHALDELSDISGAQVGDKTLMDAVVPATQAMLACEGDATTLFDAAAQAAWQGAEHTKECVAKFGRAKSYGEKTLGTPDAGAVSMARFFQGLARA